MDKDELVKRLQECIGRYGVQCSETKELAPSIELTNVFAEVNDALTGREAVHPDDIAVDKFAAAMKKKLAQKRKEGRGGWDDPEQCSIDYLTQLFHEHVAKGDPVDIGNFAMMLWHRIEATDLPRKYKKLPQSHVDADRRENYLADKEAEYRMQGWEINHAKQMAMRDWHTYEADRAAQEGKS
jgi:hypothetical protein